MEEPDEDCDKTVQRSDVIAILKQFVERHKIYKYIGGADTKPQPTDALFAGNVSGDEIEKDFVTQCLTTGLLSDIETYIESVMCDKSRDVNMKNLLVAVQALAVFSHNNDNVALISSSDIIIVIIRIAQHCVNFIKSFLHDSANTFEDGSKLKIRHEEVAQLLATILYLLENICNSSVLARNICATEGFISHLVDLVELTNSSTISINIRNILRLFRIIASHRISPFELKQMFRVLRKINEAVMLIPLLNTLSGICNDSTDLYVSRTPTHYFHFKSSLTDGLFVYDLKWPLTHSGFAFHIWFCVDKHLFNLQTQISNVLRRFQLYALFFKNNCGFEAFLTTNGSLVIGSASSKEYFAAEVSESMKYIDNQWHCIDVVYSTPAKNLQLNPFGIQNHMILHVYIDGILQLTTSLNISVAQLGVSSMFYFKKK